MVPSAFILLSLILFCWCRAQAALPATVEGQPLPSLAPMLEQTMPAVVNISTTSHVEVRENSLLNDPFFRRFFGLEPKRRERRTQSLGSGVIVDAENGYILTNQHVIKGAEEITVTLRDRRRLRAQLIGSDPDADVAVIQVRGDSLREVPIADSDSLRVGDFVVAIGNPFGLGQTVTSGIVSALGRSGLGIEGYEDFIQTDASINPGNSGGALVNLRGELVGINTAILAPSGGNIGIGFAIPANMARTLMEQLIEFGEVRRGYLGIQVQDLNPQLAQAFQLELGQGVVITKVVPGSPADQAGLEAGHIIISVDDRPIESAADLRNWIGLVPVDHTVTLKVVQKARVREIEVRLSAPQMIKIMGAEIHQVFQGAILSPIDQGNPLSGEAEGILVVEVEPYSPASQLGLRPGDIIQEVNRQAVYDLDDLRRLTRQQRELLLNLRRGERTFLVLVQ